MGLWWADGRKDDVKPHLAVAVALAVVVAVAVALRFLSEP
jgi:hypothetical protein